MSRTETKDVRRALRALVPLSALPLLWKDLDNDAIAENLACGLAKALEADFVYISVPASSNGLELAWGPEGRVPAALIPAIRASLPDVSVRRPGTIQSVLSGDSVTVLSTPLRLAQKAALVVASKRSDYPSAIDRLILRMAANEATAAMERGNWLAVARYLETLVDLSSNFIGIANLQGRPFFVNPAGLRLAGLATIEDGLARHVVDFVEWRDRDRVRYEVWPEVLSNGRWSGQLSVLNARTAKVTPLLLECFRIDAPTGEPIAVGTISVDIRGWTQAEQTTNDRQGLARTRQVMLAIASVDSLSERERQVLDGLVAGHSHKLIAHDLRLSVRTIEVHRSRMMRRLGVRTFAEAVKLAMISGIVK